MSLELNKSQLQIRKAVRDFVRGEFKKEAIEELVEGNAFPEGIWKKAAELGFIGIHFPEAVAGGGLGVFENALIAEDLCRGDSSVGCCLGRAGYGAELLLRFGTEPQKAAWLPKVAEGSVLCGAAFTEPGLGNDIARSQTVATKTGDGWLINGSKSFVVNAGPRAGCYIVLARTDADAAEPARGLSTFLVESDRAGIRVADVGKKLGCRLMPIGEVCFDQVRVPLDHLVGAENHGYDQVAAFLNESRILAAAQALGMAQGAFERQGVKPAIEASIDMNKLEALGPTVDKVKQTQPGAIIMVTAGKASTAFIREYLKTGQRPQFFGVSVLSAKALLGELGSAAHGIVIAQVVPSPLRTSYGISKEFLAAAKNSPNCEYVRAMERYGVGSNTWICLL